MRELIAKVARREGLGVREAADGVAALDELTRPPLPAAIILDLAMPLMHGMDFLVELRKVPDAADIPVIVVSAYADVPGLEALNLAAILTKPMSVSQLASLLRALVKA